MRTGKSIDAKKFLLRFALGFALLCALIAGVVWCVKAYDEKQERRAAAAFESWEGHYYDALSARTFDRALIEEGLALEACADRLSDNLRAELAIRLLDGYCVLEDYEAALARIAAGTLPGKTAEETALLKLKITAHRALKNGDGRAAADAFLAFADTFKTADDIQIDPESGDVYCDLWIRARNYARASKLYAEAGDAAQAASVADKARETFAAAVAHLEELDETDSAAKARAEGGL